MIIIDQDDNGSILDTVKYTRTSNDNPLDILNNKYSRTLWSQDQHLTLPLSKFIVGNDYFGSQKQILYIQIDQQ